MPDGTTPVILEAPKLMNVVKPPVTSSEPHKALVFFEDPGVVDKTTGLFKTPEYVRRGTVAEVVYGVENSVISYKKQVAEMATKRNPGEAVISGSATPEATLNILATEQKLLKSVLHDCLMDEETMGRIGQGMGEPPQYNEKNSIQIARALDFGAFYSKHAEENAVNQLIGIARKENTYHGYGLDKPIQVLENMELGWEEAIKHGDATVNITELDGRAIKMPVQDVVSAGADLKSRFRAEMSH